MYGALLSSAVKYTAPCLSVFVVLPILTYSYPAAGSSPEDLETYTEPVPSTFSTNKSDCIILLLALSHL